MSARLYCLVTLLVGGLVLVGQPSSTRAEGAPSQSPTRVWIDTDAACGVPGRVDPDDCFALAYLMSRPDIEIVGISTVFGNARLKETDRVTREIVGNRAPVFRGASEAGDVSETDASRAIAAALESGPMTILALGPLTNLRAVFEPRPFLVGEVRQLIVMMGKREGHLFHPSEGSETAAFFGHGPIFTDFNFVQDREAVRALLSMGFNTTLIPYEVARNVTLSSNDLTALASEEGVVGDVAVRSQDWLVFWQETVGTDGFYPFDLVAAAYIAAPGHFDCRQTGVRIGSDRRAYGPLPGPVSLMVGGLAGSESGVIGQAHYCDRLREGLHAHLMAALGVEGAGR
jgi:inosine-uridine nucleoside N-ribohydrolase